MKNYLLAGIVVAASGAAQAEDDPVLEAVVGYMDFATATEGIILPAQLTEDVFGDVFFVDARSADAYASGTIGNAINIDWREIPGRLDEIPETGMVVVFCNTGVRSSQAVFASRLLGRDNILVMQSGYDGWQVTGAYKP